MKKALLSASLVLGGCETSLPEGLSFLMPRGQQPIPGTIIDTVPTGATVTLEDGSCTTPCRIDYGQTVEVIVAKAGYQPLRVSVPLGAPNAVLELTPVGRSTPVEEETLPLL